jgi:hypothetical protein
MPKLERTEKAPLSDTQVQAWAKHVVYRMLNARCQPEDSDVHHITQDADEQERIIIAIYKVLQELSGHLKT